MLTLNKPTSAKTADANNRLSTLYPGIPSSEGGTSDWNKVFGHSSLITVT